MNNGNTADVTVFYLSNSFFVGPATIHYTDEMLMEFSKIEKDKDRFRVTSDVLNQTFDYRAD